MSINELLLRIFYASRPLLPYVGIVAAATVAAMVVLLALGSILWFDSRGFRWLGVFYGMEGLLSVRLGSAWIKLCLTLTYLAAFQPLKLVHYLILLVPVVIYAIDTRIPGKIPGNLLSGAMQMAGVAAANIICGYYHDVSRNGVLVLVYIFISLIIALYSAYLFLTELNSLSQGRRPRNDAGTGK